MNKTIEVIQEVLNAFTQQELGNKVTQFNMSGLLQMIVGKLKENEEKGEN